MTTYIPLLRNAMARVDRERSAFSAEQCAFEQFREAVRLTRPETEEEGPSAAAEELLETYRREVMDSLDYEETYDESLAESLEREFSPAIAEALLSGEPFTQRRKRNFLLKTTERIERREQCLAELRTEHEALETFVDELSDVEATLDALPECSPRQHHLEELLTIWEEYETLEQRCERLLERRQQQLREAERSGRLFAEKHAFYDYLYGDMESPYPVLSAVARTCRWIRSGREGTESADTPGQPIEY